MTQKLYSEIIEDKGTELKTISELIYALGQLKVNVHFTRYNKIITEELSKLQKQLERETEQIAIYRLQGQIESFRKCLDLDSFEKHYKTKFQRINQNG